MRNYAGGNEEKYAPACGLHRRRLSNRERPLTPRNPWAVPRWEINYEAALIVWRPG